MRRTIASIVAATALTAVIALPTLAAPPTYSGWVICTVNGDGTNGGGGSFYVSGRKKQVNDEIRAHVGSGELDCAKGTIDDSGVHKD